MYSNTAFAGFGSEQMEPTLVMDKSICREDWRSLYMADESLT